jgi:hypothetical protein
VNTAPKKTGPTPQTARFDRCRASYNTPYGYGAAPVWHGLPLPSIVSAFGAYGASMPDSGRLFLCALCRAQVIVCRECDCGQVYCGAECADDARRASLLAAGRRYQRSLPGRTRHAARQRRYRQRQREMARLPCVLGAADAPPTTTSTTSASTSLAPIAGANPSESCHCCERMCRVERVGPRPLPRAARSRRCRHCQQKVTHHPCSKPAADVLLAPTSTTAASPAGTAADTKRSSGQCRFCHCVCEFVRHGPLRRRVIRQLRSTKEKKGFDP